MQHTWSETIRLIRSDIRRYTYLLRDERMSIKRVGPFAGLRAFVVCQGLQAVLVYRLGQKIYHPNSSRVLRMAGFAPFFLLQRWIEITTGITISPRAQIGAGLYIGHFGGVIIGPVRMGENCNISHGVTIGRGVSKGSTGRPTLGNRVWIGPGAKVSGPIELGDDCVVGANAVAVKDVPTRAFAVGIPAEIKSNRGSFDLVVYEGMDRDPSRLASIEKWSADRREADRAIDLDSARLDIS